MIGADKADRKIKIWSTIPILDPNGEKDTADHKLLCTMSEHTGESSAMQWSPRLSAL